MENHILAPLVSIFGGITLAKILEYFGVEGQTVLILGIVLGLDFIFWVVAAYVCDKSSVTSIKARQGITKKLTRFFLPFIIIAALKGMGVEQAANLVNIVFITMIATETYSIISHIYAINFKKKLPEIDVFEYLLRNIGAYIVSLMVDPNKKNELIKPSELFKKTDPWTEKNNENKDSL